MSPTVIAAIFAVGLGLAFALRGKASAPPPASPFFLTNGVRYWRADIAGNIAAFLAKHDLVADPNVERVYRFAPSGKGLKPALEAVRALQAAGNVVTSTVNLLEPGAEPKGLASLLASEFPAKAANQDGVAVLPKV